MKLTEEVRSHYKGRGIGPEKTAQIEAALIENISVATICETVGVSNPTVYVIKERLRKEGKLPT